MELRARGILLFSRTPWLGRLVVPPFHTASLNLLYWPLPSCQRPRVSSIFQDLRLILSAHTQSGWGVIAKAEEYGPVRCRLLYCSIDSLLLGLFLHCAHSSFQGHYGMPSTSSSSAISLGHPGLPWCILGIIYPRRRPWALT